MTQTIQSISQFIVEEAKNRCALPSSRVDTGEPEEDNLLLLASVFDSLSILYGKLSELNCVLEKK